MCTSLTKSNRIVVSADAAIEAVVVYFGKFGKIRSAWANYNTGTNPMFSLLFEDEHTVSIRGCLSYYDVRTSPFF